MTTHDDFMLKITREGDGIWIRGNRKGLEYLSDIARRIIGKTDPSGHEHIYPRMGNASDGSEKVRLEFSDDPEDY